jgi:hypothetical protein
VVANYQLVAAQQAVAAVGAQVAEQGVTAPAVAGVATAALAGVASSGLPLVDVLHTAQNLTGLSMLVSTMVSDAGRQASLLSISSRPGLSGYVRMLNPPSCSRCVVQAGKFFRTNEGFERHPGCDCIHVAVGNEDMAHELGLISNPNKYFDSLTAEVQNRTFTKAGAEAIRQGADIGQVVNARSGMNTAQIMPRGWIPKGRLASQDVFGRHVFTTTSGITRRGLFGKANESRTRKLPVRLMPESVIALAKGNPDEARRLLSLYGYLL